MSTTKNHPGKFRCYDQALPDEPMFVILGRDPAGPATLAYWAHQRGLLGKDQTDDDIDRILAARQEAKDMADWREKHLDPHGDGVAAWRLPRPEPDGGRPIRMDPALGAAYGEGRAFENRLHTQRELMVSVGKAIRDAAHELDEWRRSKGPVNSTSAVLIDGVVGKMHAEVERLAEAARAIKLSETDPYVEFAKSLGKPVEQEYYPGGDADPIKVTPLSFTRMEELLDYATAYGEFDENTPSGTESEHGDAFSSPMNDMRRSAIWTLKRCMGIIPEGANPPVADDGPKPNISLMLRTDGLFKIPNVEQPQTMEQIAEVYRKSVTENLRVDGVKPPTMDTKPDDLAHAPEVPAHRFAAFHESGSYAYARGLEVAPMHLPSALDAMARSNWHLVTCFGATDSANIGFIFRRGIGEDLPNVDLGRGQEP